MLESSSHPHSRVLFRFTAFSEEAPVDKAWTSRLAGNGKTAFHPSWMGLLASLAIAALVAALALAAQCRSVAHVHRSCRKACRRAPAQPGASTRISPGAPISFEYGSVPVAALACAHDRVFVRSHATAYLRTRAHTLTFWRLPVRADRLSSTW